MQATTILLPLLWSALPCGASCGALHGVSERESPRSVQRKGLAESRRADVEKVKEKNGVVLLLERLDGLGRDGGHSQSGKYFNFAKINFKKFKNA